MAAMGYWESKLCWESRTAELVQVAAGTVAWWLEIKGVGVRQGTREEPREMFQLPKQAQLVREGGRGRRENEGSLL